MFADLTLQAIHQQTTYPVYVGHHGETWIVACLQMLPRVQRVAIISDAAVATLHAERLRSTIAQTGRHVTVLTFPSGEAQKSLATVQTLYAALAQAQIGRHDAIVGLGGGVTTDLSGFVAATYLRGVAHISAPTSTLAAIDASVGGKNGVNTSFGKNTVGTICAPHAVVVDLTTLATLPLPHARAGLVEALKMGALYDAALCDQVVQASATCLELGNLIHRALALKIKVCQEDPDDRGMRAALNYGHTVGHAIEAGSQYTMLHGEAVALGMVAEAQFAATQGATDATAVQLQQALRAMNMPVDWRRATLDFHALGHDKKRSGSKVTLPIVKRLGEVSLQQVALCDLEDFLRSHP